MPLAAAVIGAAVIGGGASIIAGNKSAKAQTKAADQSTALQQQQMAEAQRQYDTSRADLAPYREAGYTALGQLASGTAAGGDFNRNYTMNDLVMDPGYQFRLSEGQRGVESSAAARGGVLSGATLKALDQYNQGFASNEVNNAYNRYSSDLSGRYNRLAGVAGTGQQAINSTNAAGQALTQNTQNGVNNITSNINAAANANSSQYTNTANAIGNAANSAANGYLTLKSLGSGGWSPSNAFTGYTASDYGFG
jgi:hypothetical protein